MARIDIARVVGPEDVEESRGLLWVKQTWNTQKSRPRRIWYYFIAVLLLLQGLVLWRFFFRQEETVAAGPAYDQDETVKLITAWYELLQDMRYLGKDMIAYPPHTGERAINISLAENILGLDEKVVETLLALPYIIPHEDRQNENGEYFNDAEVLKAHENAASWWQGWMGQDRDILWKNGHFIDYRNDSNLWLSRDPLGKLNAYHSDTSLLKQPQYLQAQLRGFSALPSTAIPLSIVRHPKYGLALVLDTASNRILVLDTEADGNKDPFFHRFEKDKVPAYFRIPKTKFYGQELEARLAPHLLKDFISQTAKLHAGFVPGSVRTDEQYTPELSPPKWEKWVRDLYRQHGWPKGEPLEQCHWLSLQSNNTCDHDPYEHFKGPLLDRAMAKLRHDITVRYMGDWYCPVPRDPDFLAKLKMKHPGKLTEEQMAYAESSEPVIPQNLGGWGESLFWLQE